MPSSTAWAILALAAQIATAAPAQQVLAPAKAFDPLKHLSAISPFFIPTAEPAQIPKGYKVERVSILIRHSAILGNDDEYEQTMGPFLDKIYAVDKAKFPSFGPWAFLKNHTSPIVVDNVEKIGDRGKKDAKMLGKYIRGQYNSLFPSRKRGAKGVKKGKKQPTYKVWTASSQRDIDSAKAYIKGSFPKHQSGKDGEGDGEVVQLIKVPNKAKDWDRSLTPHKACAAWEKDSALIPANKWLGVYAPRIRERIQPDMPDLVQDLDDQDILAMQMLCGYETIAQGQSNFCSLFTEEEWRDAEYYFDIRWYHSIGYGSHLSPYLGMPWVKTALHLLEGHDSHVLYSTDPEDARVLEHDLPGPKVPPNATHTQLLHPSFTHRESPAFVAVFLNLYNSASHPFPASNALPLDHRVTNRAWKTSHLISFLGHVALERFKHKHTGQSFVRAVVNGKQEEMGGCADGVEGSCRWETFKMWVQDRAQQYADWESVCEPEEEIESI